MFSFFKKLFSKSKSQANESDNIDILEAGNNHFNQIDEVSKSTIVDPIDIYKLTDDYLNATGEEREAIIKSFDEESSWHLLLESKTLAVEAVKQNNYELVKKGLILHSIENSRNDWRDNLVRLSLLYNSGKKLNENPNILFEEIASISQKNMKELLLSFIQREEKDKSIDVMGYKEVSSPSFDYISFY